MGFNIRCRSGRGEKGLETKNKRGAGGSRNSGKKMKKRRTLRFGRVKRMKRERQPYMDMSREREAIGCRGRSGWTMSLKT